MLEGIYTEGVLQFKEIRPYPIEPQETSGVSLGSQTIYRYSLQDSDYPILILVENISDGEGHKIEAGHYELALSDERDFLILMQTKNPVAIIPAFKIEEEKINTDKKYKKIKKKQQKEREKTNKKRARKGMPPDVEPVYMNATIEYVKEGNYYLIKYERDRIRAWGAIKAE